MIGIPEVPSAAPEVAPQVLVCPGCGEKGKWLNVGPDALVRLLRLRAQMADRHQFDSFVARRDRREVAVQRPTSRRLFGPRMTNTRRPRSGHDKTELGRRSFSQRGLSWRPIHFPDGFVWGAATAAAQIEGAALGWQGRIDLGPLRHAARATSRTAIRPRSPAIITIAIEADFDLLVELGIGHYRLSIAWPRVFPSG